MGEKFIKMGERFIKMGERFIEMGEKSDEMRAPLCISLKLPHGKCEVSIGEGLFA